jgi:RNA polymerase sigma factor (sigma-70 family)
MRTDDGHIIRECLNGDSASFGLLVDKYKAGIFALAYDRLHNFHDAEDVTQEVFIKAYVNLRTLRQWDSFVVWLRSTAINLCKDKLRAKSRRGDIYINDQNQKILENASLDSYHDEQSSLWRNEALNSLDKALSSLPEQYRQVLTLHYLGGMSGEEIAKFLSISHVTVRQRLSRAREYLKAEVLAMMSETFEQQKLQATFTFRIVEMVKRIKIHPISTMKGLPWGLSLATGIMITVMSINPTLISFNNFGTSISTMLSSESKVLNIGEIPVSVIKTSNIAVLSNKMGKGKGGEPENVQNTFFMAPQAEGGEWAKRADMPTGRMDISSAAVNGKIYVIGGSAINVGPAFSVVEEYNPATDIWTTKADMPTARAASSSAAVEGKIYTIGGTTNDNDCTGLPTVEEYDPLTDKWVKKADMPTPRWGLSTSVVNGKIYAIGGCLRFPNAGAGGVGVPLAVVEEYNPETDTWTKKADMPTTPRWYHSSSVVNGKIYVIGGTTSQENKFSIVEEYDPVTDTWTRKTDMPTARWALSTSASGGRIYAIGGPFQAAGAKIVEEYNPVTDTWKKVADMPTKRLWLTASEVNGKIYVIGGVIGNFWDLNWNLPEWKGLSTIEEYTPEDWQSEQSIVSPQGKLPTKWGTIKYNR